MSKKKRIDANRNKKSSSSKSSPLLPSRIQERENKQLQRKLQAKNEPVYLAARVEERAPKFAKR